MIKKRSKLRLRKQFIISFPIAIIVSFLAFTYILSQNTALAKEVEKEDTLTNNVIEVTPESGEEKKSLLSDNIYVEELTKRVSEIKKDQMIEYYASLYNLNTTRAVEIARYYTDNYRSELYQTTHIISTPYYMPPAGNITSDEAGIIYFVKDLYTYPERYGSSIPEMRLSEVPQTTRRYDEAGNIIMSNGMTFEQYVGYISDLFGVDKATVLAISYHEAGVKTSNLFQFSNNIGGHKGLNGWKKFMSLEAGIIGHVISVRNIAIRAGGDITTYEGLTAFSSIYVNGHVGNPSMHWTDKVTYFRNQINSKDLFTIE